MTTSPGSKFGAGCSITPRSSPVVRGGDRWAAWVECSPPASKLRLLDLGVR
jgi:hypothetical protein